MRPSQNSSGIKDFFFSSLTTQRLCAFIITHTHHNNPTSPASAKSLVAKGGSCHQVAMATCFQADTGALRSVPPLLHTECHVAFCKCVLNAGMVLYNKTKESLCEASQ